MYKRYRGFPGILCLGVMLVASRCVWAATLAQGAEPLLFTYPSSQDSVYQQRDQYFVGLLELALRKSQHPFKMQPVSLSPMSEKRSKLFLKSQRYNVHWLLTSNELEQELLPIRVPLYKGLIGWRLMVISQQSVERFAEVRSLDQLKLLVATQGLGWPDTHVLHASNFNLRLAVDWPGLLEMVAKHNADYLPLALNEIWAVAGTLADKALVVEDRLALHYPSAYYFFVSKSQPRHAEVLHQGLMAAVADGSFDAFFMEYFGEAIRRSQLQKRQIFTLENRFLPPDTPLHDERLWYRLD